MKKIYVILVNYNGTEDTIQCVESLRKVNKPDFKIIIVDNGSSDNSVQEIKKITDENTILIEAGDNLGFSGGNNLGIKFAMNDDVDYVLLLNNDTLVEPDFLSIIIERAEKEKGKSVIAPKIYYAYDREHLWYAGGTFSKFTSRTTHIGINEKNSEKFDVSKKVSFMTGCCMLIPTDIIKKVGLLDEDFFLYCEDLDYSCRIVKNGYKLIYEPKAVIYHKVSASTGKVSDIYTYYMVRNKYYIIKRHIKGIYRCIAGLYSALENYKRVLSKEYSKEAVMKAKRDYKSNIVGKADKFM